MTDKENTGFGGLFGQRSPMAGHATVLAESLDTAEEALIAAGLDWQVEKRPLWFTGIGKGSKPVKVDGQFATVRADTGEFLGAVTDRYGVVQNAEAFSWADGLGKYVFGGSLYGGKQVYMGVELKTVIMGGDEHVIYAVSTNGHAGRKSLGTLITPVRTFCTNQFAGMRRNALAGWTARHSHTVLEKASAAQSDLLGIVDRHIEVLTQKADHMAELKMTMERAEQTLGLVMPDRPKVREAILANLRTSTTITDEQRSTAWGLYNATTEYLEWGRATSSSDARLQATLDGDAARTGEKLLEALTA
jgi:phage/plasmid-like protein (TIGR03299 family)